ncbi:MAG TPA: amidohydrolase family protein [Puia sp.]|nr:amidohydrolase family protein [Puia sp.]
MNIDSHVHFWKYEKKRYAWINDDMKVLQQDYLPDQLSVSLRRNGMDACVAVQADQSELETRFLVELAKNHKEIKGIVGWVDLQSPNLENRLRHFAEFGLIRGYRHIVQGEVAGFLLKPEFLHGVALLKEFNYTYDILIYHYQLAEAVSFVRNFPDHRLVIDHCAKPDIRRKEIDDWRKHMKEIAQQGNVYCKISGLFTEAAWKGWSVNEFYPYLDSVFEFFGPDRLMFGSDWPVILVSGLYVQWKSLLENYMQNFDIETREKVFGLNATRFYGI